MPVFPSHGRRWLFWWWWKTVVLWKKSTLRVHIKGSDVMVWWCDGVVVWWCDGVMLWLLWCGDGAMLMAWCCIYCDAVMVRWCCDGTMLRNDVMVWWYDGAMALWCDGEVMVMMCTVIGDVDGVFRGWYRQCVLRVWSTIMPVCSGVHLLVLELHLIKPLSWCAITITITSISITAIIITITISQHHQYYYIILPIPSPSLPITMFHHHPSLFITITHWLQCHDKHCRWLNWKKELHGHHHSPMNSSNWSTTQNGAK